MAVRTPSGLDTAGRRLWRDVIGAYELRPDELVLLEKAARTADDSARLDAAVADGPLMVAGSMGQLREHPLLAQSRQTRALLAALLKQIDLPDEEQATGADTSPRRSATSVRAMNASAARWGHRGRTANGA